MHYNFMDLPTRSEVEKLRREKGRYLTAKQQAEQKLSEAEERLRNQQGPPRPSKPDNRPSSTHRESVYWQTDVASDIFPKEISNKEEKRA